MFNFLGYYLLLSIYCVLDIIVYRESVSMSLWIIDVVFLYMYVVG